MMGKQRSGHPMRRTTSLTEFALADVAEELQLPTHAEEEEEAASAEKEKGSNPYGWAVGRSDWRGLRRSSAAAFLRACGLCNRRLGPGRDTFMYRGDTAFCSLECRQQHITIEEWKEKCTALSPPQADDPVTTKPASESQVDKSGAASFLPRTVRT